jgi:hypothetical protein
MHNHQENTSLFYSRDTSLSISRNSSAWLANLPAKELDLDPIGQDQSPVSDRVEGRLSISLRLDIVMDRHTT